MERAERWNTVSDTADLVKKSGLLLGPGKFHDSVDQLFSAATNEEQARLLRSLSSTLPDSGFLVVLATHILVTAEIKSPVRGAAVRTLLSLPCNIVADQLAVLLRPRLLSDSVEADAIVLAMLTGLFENFPPGVAAVDQCLPQVLPFLHTALHRAVATLHAPTSVKTAHAACRLVVLVLQKCMLRDPKQDTIQELREILDLLLANVSGLMMLAIPMETGANAALATLLLVALVRGEGAALALSQVDTDTELAGVDLSDDKCRLHLTTATLTQRWALPHAHRLLEQLLDLALRNAGDGDFQLSVARAVHQHLRSRGNDPVNEPGLRDRVSQSVFRWLQHPRDSVRHAARDCLEALLGTLQTDRQAALLASVASLPWRPRLVAVETVARRLGGRALLVAMPTLPDDLRRAMAEPQLGKNAGAAYERLIRDSHAWTEPSDWLARWVEPALAYNQGPARTVALAAAAELEPAWFARTANDSQTDMQVALCCAQIGHRLGLGSISANQPGQSDEPTTWRGLVPTATMEAALGHRDHETRLRALWLLAGDRCASTPPTAQDLRLLRTGISRNAATDDEAARMEALAAVKRCLRRIKDSAAALARDQRTDLAEAHASFLRWLAQWCQDSLFPGANFARRSFALATLEQLSPVDVATLVSPGVLVAALRDPFESNRNAARSLLKRYSLDQLGLESEDAMSQLVLQSLTLSESSRPPDPPVAAHLLRLLAAFNQSRAAFRAADSQADEGEVVACPRLLAVRLLIGRLRAQIAVAQRSLLLAASTAPMYGTAHCVRALLSDVPLESLSGDAAWGLVVGQLVSCCEDMLTAAGPLCSSCSPEGLLPEEIQLEDTSQVSADVDVPVATAQMALICAWRSVKEAALLLGNLAERLPIGTIDGGDGLLTEDSLDRIGERLLLLLQETRHRGAFEQAQVAVTAVARRLWQRGSSKPVQWLDDVVTEIATGSDLCETRRGAGLPLLVTALLSSQPGHQEAVSVATRLLVIAGQGHSMQAANRVAALNVLRAAFRDSQLGSTLTPLLSIAMETAMAATAVTAWPERSAGTLLFAALTTRLLGVESAAGQRSSAPAIIQRHPALADALATALAGSEPARLPALTLLAKLSPALSDESVQLRALASLVESCAGCQGMHLRRLAALALSALVPRERRPDALVRTLRRLETAAGANERHGNLLMLDRLLTPPPPPEVAAQVSEGLCRLAPALVADGNGPVLAAWAQCVESISVVKNDARQLSALHEALELCARVRVRHDIGDELVQDCVARAMLSVATALATKNDIEVATTRCLQTDHSLKEESLAIESLALMSLASVSLTSTSKAMPLQIGNLETNSLATLTARLMSSRESSGAALSFLKTSPEALLDCVEIREAMHAVLDSDADDPQVLELCCRRPALLRPSDWHRALRLADSDSEPMRCAAIGCLAWLLPPEDGWERLITALEEGAGEERSTACHLQVAKVVSRLVTAPAIGATPAVTWLRIHTLLVDLLQHCEASVRDAATPTWPDSLIAGRDWPREPHGVLDSVLSALSSYEHAAVALVAWSWCGLMNDVQLSQQACPFDRGEPNGFAEAGLVAQLCCDRLGQFGAAAWTNPVPNDVMRWLAHHVGVDTGRIHDSLGEFLAAVEVETRQLQGCDWQTLDWQSFFAPDFAPSVVAEYRKRLVLNAAKLG